MERSNAEQAPAPTASERYELAIDKVHRLRDERFHAAAELSELLHAAVECGPGNSICHIDVGRASEVMRHLVEVDYLLNQAIVEANHAAREAGKPEMHGTHPA